jgi:cold shock CspA family protein
MKDRIIESYLNDFVEENYLSDLNEHEAFEQFINYCIVSKIHAETFDFEDISVGGGGDSGLDGIAILVNEHLVSSREDIEFFKNRLRRLDVQFIFIQSKTSQKFSMKEIGNFLFGVKSFFNTESEIIVNTQVEYLRELKEYIYDSSIDMDRNPVCHMYFTTTGKWTDDKNLTERINSGIKELERTDLFSEVRFIPVDAEKIKSIYRELKHKIVKEILFERHTILPSMQGIQEAYIGILPASEYIKLICDSDGNLQRNLFYDNVRDFQGNNSVNEEIAKTIRDTKQNSKFALLNNGLTIVAKSINKIGAKFKLKDYQVVNGCQTTHVLYQNQEYLHEGIYLPIKLIVTDNIDTTNQIIKATNRQTEVKIEAFESLSPFHKELEEFYTAFGKNQSPRLYYERRSKQYEHLPINKGNIISLTAQVKSFLSMFLNEPHSTHRYYGELLSAYRNRIFLKNHSPFPYYIGGYALHILEHLFNEGKFERSYKQFKYQMLMLYRIQAEEGDMPYLNSRSIGKYCEHLLRKLSNEEKTLAIFENAKRVIQEVLDDAGLNSRDATRRRAFTDKLISYISQDKQTSFANTKYEKGIVKWFSDIKGYGFIDGDERTEDVFVHISDVREYYSIRKNDRVEFTVLETDRGLQAQNIQLLDEQ